MRTNYVDKTKSRTAIRKGIASLKSALGEYERALDSIDLLISYHDKNFEVDESLIWSDIAVTVSKAQNIIKNNFIIEDITEEDAENENV